MRGVLYIRWPGERDDHATLNRSLQSLEKQHPGMPSKVIELQSGTLLDKARMFDLSPFEQTLYLDLDTVVMGDLSYGFEKASEHGLACSICECPWARRYPSAAGDMIEYNTGVLFFTKKAEPVFDAWKRLAGTVDSSSRFQVGQAVGIMPLNDQAGFALAVEETRFNPWVLPLNWNFRHRWQRTAFGPVKIWHDYAPVPDWLWQWNQMQTPPDAVLRGVLFP